MGLTGQDDGAVLTLENDRLVSSDVSRSRDDMDAGRDLTLAVEKFVTGAVEVDQCRNGVFRGAGGFELLALAEDWPTREQRVCPDVVEVQMAVDDEVDVIDCKGHRS